MIRFIKIWIGLMILVILALAIHPATAPYVRWQPLFLFQRDGCSYLSVSIDGWSKLSPHVRKCLQHRIQLTMKQHPNDLQMQIGGVFLLGEMSGTSAVFFSGPPPALRELEGHFPHSPELHATILRLEHQRFRWDRQEESVMSPSKTSSPPPQPLTRQEINRIRRLLDQAIAGERSDPDNAFFPAVRANLLFALRRDEEALNALKQAAQQPKWDDYAQVEPQSRTKVKHQAFTEKSAIFDLSDYTITLFPHYARMRSMARLVVYHATQLEKAGDLKGGMELRIALARYGSLMRSQSRTLIGSLVGAALTSIATTQPGGQSPIALSSGSPSEERAEERRQRFFTYLLEHRFTSEAQWFREELARLDQMRSVTKTALNDPRTNSLERLISTALSLVLCLALLEACILLFLCQIVLILMNRLKWNLFIKVGTMLMAGAFALIWFAVSDSGTFGKTILVTVAQINELTAAPIDKVILHRWVIDYFPWITAGGLMGFLCLIVLMTFWRAALSSRDDIGNKIETHLTRALLIATACFVTTYLLALLGYFRAERDLNEFVVGMAQHEGQFNAERLGQTWPSETPPLK